MRLPPRERPRHRLAGVRHPGDDPPGERGGELSDVRRRQVRADGPAAKIQLGTGVGLDARAYSSPHLTGGRHCPLHVRPAVLAGGRLGADVGFTAASRPPPVTRSTRGHSAQPPHFATRPTPVPPLCRTATPHSALAANTSAGAAAPVHPGSQIDWGALPFSRRLNAGGLARPPWSDRARLGLRRWPVEPLAAGVRG